MAFATLWLLGGLFVLLFFSLFNICGLLALWRCAGFWSRRLVVYLRYCDLLRVGDSAWEGVFELPCRPGDAAPHFDSTANVGRLCFVSTTDLTCHAIMHCSLSDMTRRLCASLPQSRPLLRSARSVHHPPDLTIGSPPFSGCFGFQLRFFFFFGPALAFR